MKWHGGQVPAVLMVCRNSTDTAYFQRLRPYPRVLLRRTNTLFKDYDKTPIGFGIVVFCVAKAPCQCVTPPSPGGPCCRSTPSEIAATCSGCVLLYSRPLGADERLGKCKACTH